MNKQLCVFSSNGEATSTKAIFSFYMMSLIASQLYFLVYPYVVFFLTKGGVEGYIDIKIYL